MITNKSLRARDLINESAGDVIITKAIVLAPDYNPSTIDNKKVLSFNVHAIYNSYRWNTLTNQVSKGMILSHSDLVDRNCINSNKIIGYFVKENSQILEYELMPCASKVLTDKQIVTIESELKKLIW